MKENKANEGDSACDGALDTGTQTQSNNSESVKVVQEPINIIPVVNSPYRIIRSHKGRRDGLYYYGKDLDDKDLPPIWICSPLEITARTNDGQGQGWGCFNL